MENNFASGLSIHVSEGCLVVPIQGEIDDSRILRIQKDILKGVEKTGVKGVVMDISGVRIIEPLYARMIDNTAKMISLLGAKTVLAGVRPGVAISLSDSDFEFEGIYAIALTFEEGVKKLQSIIRKEEGPEIEKKEDDEDAENQEKTEIAVSEEQDEKNFSEEREKEGS